MVYLRKKTAITSILVLSLVFSGFQRTASFAWVGVPSYDVKDMKSMDDIGHVKIAKDSYINYCTDFNKYLEGKLDRTITYRNYFKKYLLVADNKMQQKEFITSLKDWKTSLVTMQTEDGTIKFDHCASTVKDVYNKEEYTRLQGAFKTDARLYNSVVLLHKAIKEKKSKKKAPALKELAYGAHLLTDYFAHQNAVGGSGHLYMEDKKTTVSVTINNKVVTKKLEDVIDDIHYDNDGVGIYGIYSDGKINKDILKIDTWKYVSDPMESWRYQCAVILCAKYLQAFMKEDLNFYTNVLEKAQKGEKIKIGPKEKYSSGRGASVSEALDHLLRNIEK